MERSRKLIYILWPSFLVAGAAEVMFFTMVDPSDLSLFGEPLAASAMSVYTIGFFVFWAFAAASSALTCFLQRSSADVNRLCPVADAGQRPAGCPRSTGAGG